jgi:hypothetical protein
VRLLLDEIIPLAAAQQLRARGHDVVAVNELEGLAGTADPELFEFAQQQHRAIVTENIPDFVRLDRGWREAGREHHGLVFALKRHGTGRKIVGWLVRELDRLLADHPGEEPSSLVTWI